MSELKLVLFELTFYTESDNIENVYHNRAVRRYKVRNDAWGSLNVTPKIE
jgi:hypothetical protein